MKFVPQKKWKKEGQKRRAEWTHISWKKPWKIRKKLTHKTENQDEKLPQGGPKPITTGPIWMEKVNPKEHATHQNMVVNSICRKKSKNWSQQTGSCIEEPQSTLYWSHWLTRKIDFEYFEHTHRMQSIRKMLPIRGHKI